jgi:RNA polymerase primary sigma factor
MHATPLSKLFRLAVVTGISRAVQVHIDRGDDLNARDGEGRTPLMLAAARNKAAICKLLLDAGADGSLQDPTGKTAHDIAVAAFAHDAAAVIETSKIQPPNQAPTYAAPILDVGGLEEQAFLAAENQDSDEPPTAADFALGVTDPPLDLERETPFSAEALLVEGPAMNIISEPSLAAHAYEEQERVAVDPDDDLEFDLSGWEAEEERAPPAADPVIVVIAGAIQAAISDHAPIDSYVEWSDVEAFLPDRASPLARAADTETRSKLRALLLRAMREGIASDHEIDELSTNEDGTANADARELLLMVINDLGAEIYDWLGLEFSSSRTGYLEASAESPEEEALLDEAFAFIDGAASHRNEPLRAYQREFQQIALIDSEQEVALGQSMERSLDAALDALAAWPLGIARTISAGLEVISGRKTLAWMSRGAAEPASDDENESGGPDEIAEDLELKAELSSANQEVLGDSSFVNAIKVLERLGTCTVSSQSDEEAVRESLSALNLSRSFLLELADISDPAMPDGRAAYVGAMAEYLKAREAMTCANLKLVFHIAKKYLYSGLPLDDLTQEGNLGLLKAVDRYDWRLGFKFSTYATWWIRQQVSRYVADKGRTIRVPVHIHEKMQRLRRVADDFEASHGRPANVDELAKLVDMSSHKTAGIMRLLPDTVSLHDISIDEFIAAGAQDSFVSTDPMEIASTSELADAVHWLLDTLEVKQAKILRLRYGIGGEEPMTLDEVGKCFGLTRERIRQVESKLLRKLRSAVNFAREAIGIENIVQPIKRRKIRDQEEIEELVVEDNTVNGLGDEGSIGDADLPREEIRDFDQATSSRRAKKLKLSPIDEILSLASELGVSYIDERSNSSGMVFINLVEVPDKRFRRFVRLLLDNGFSFWPGKGYWR